VHRGLRLPHLRTPDDSPSGPGTARPGPQPGLPKACKPRRPATTTATTHPKLHHNHPMAIDPRPRQLPAQMSLLRRKHYTLQTETELVTQ
jgi:hypothetical protein